jgi:hypothetical protein
MDQGTNQQNVQSTIAPIPDKQSDGMAQQPQQPIGNPSKEHSPIVGQSINQEMIRPTEQEPVLAPELKDAGVTIVQSQEHIQLNPDLKAVGVAPVKTAIPVQATSSDMIQLPMTEKEAERVAKTHPAIDSIRWLATLIIEQARKIHRSFN